MKSQKIPDIPKELSNRQPVVIFDGECALCSKSVQFLLRHNYAGNLSFASLQSDVGKKVSPLAGIPVSEYGTLILLQDNIVFTFSTAALKISAHLHFPWRFFELFIIIPTAFRDPIYKFIARNRYKWFGRETFCFAGEKLNKDRFIT